eukprot:3786512-Karenia_brevis.AAC.1
MEESCPDILVLCVCRRERHRSIATKELLVNYLNRNKDKYRIKVEYAKPPIFPSHFLQISLRGMQSLYQYGAEVQRYAKGRGDDFQGKV